MGGVLSRAILLPDSWHGRGGLCAYSGYAFLVNG